MRFIKSLFAVIGVFCLFVAASTAAPATSLQKDLHYQLINPPLPVETPGKIEVTEFFSFGCSHCYQFDPAITAWTRKLPADVRFTRVPLVNGQWSGTGKLFYTLEALGVEEKLHTEVFKAIHVDRSMMPDADMQAWAAWAGKRGVDPKQFSLAYNFVGGKITQAETKIKSLGGKGVPAIVVNGRYLVLSNTIESWEDLLALTDQVIEMVRTNNKSGKK